MLLEIYATKIVSFNNTGRQLSHHETKLNQIQHAFLTKNAYNTKSSHKN